MYITMSLLRRRHSANPILTLLALGLLTLALGACEREGKTDGDEDETDPAVPVEVTAAAYGDIQAVYTTTATLEAEGEAAVVAKVAGEVEEILVEEGDQVAKGQVLARLDGDRLRLQLAQNAANLEKLQRDYQRQLELRERGLVSNEAVETTKFDLNATQAAHDLADLEYRYTWIRAPIDGVVAERSIKVGNTIAVGDPTFRVVDRSPLRAELFVPEKEYLRMAANQQVRVSVDALAEDTFSGQIARISPTMDPATGTFKVTVEVLDASARLRPGMFARVGVVYDTRANALMIPRAALLGSAARTLFVVEDGVALRRDVETGFANADQIEVVDGLTVNEQVVTVGQTGLRDGTPVEIVNIDDDIATAASALSP